MSEREFLRGEGRAKKKRRGGEPTKKRGEKKRKEGRKKKREEERRLRNLMSIGPSNRGRSISNFDITF